MISYTNTVAVKLNYAVAAVTIVLVYLSLLRIASVAKVTSEQVITWFVLILVVQVVAVVLGVGLPIIVAYVFDKYGLTLTYYSTPILSLGLYVCPSLVGLALPSCIYLKLQKNVSILEKTRSFLQDLTQIINRRTSLMSNNSKWLSMVTPLSCRSCALPSTIMDSEPPMSSPGPSSFTTFPWS